MKRQGLKTLLILILMPQLALAGSNEDLQNLKKDFVETTGLKAGEYRLIKSNDNFCPADGKVEIVKTADSLSVMMGAILLTGGVGLSESESEDQDCKILSKADYSKNNISTTNIMDCKDGRFVFNRHIYVSGDKFTFKKEVITSNKTKKIRCEYKLVKKDSK